MSVCYVMHQGDGTSWCLLREMGLTPAIAPVSDAVAEAIARAGYERHVALGGPGGGGGLRSIVLQVRCCREVRPTGAECRIPSEVVGVLRTLVSLVS